MALHLPVELSAVSESVLKSFLAQFSRALTVQLAVNAPDDVLEGAVSAVWGSLSGVAAAVRPEDVRLEFRHVCRFSGCQCEDCQLCRNNPNKVCDGASVLDQQYWVRDDSRGGQIVKARCGADIELQLVSRSNGQPQFLPDVRIKLYVVDGQPGSSPAPGDALCGLYRDDSGKPLFGCQGLAPDEDGALILEMRQDEQLGPCARIPDLQFLNKNSKFRAGGRTFKSFKLLARAVVKGLGPSEEVLSQVESEPFKVTTKKGYDGCRKAEYLQASQVITDKTFASMGDTTIGQLKATFTGVNTVDDLQLLVARAKGDSSLQAQLRDVLHMGRDGDKWRSLVRLLETKVVRDDDLPRAWVPPAAASGSPGLLFGCKNGQVEFAEPMGVFLQPPVLGILVVSPLTQRLQQQCGSQVEQLRHMALACWHRPQHPGWRREGALLEWAEIVPLQLQGAWDECMCAGSPLLPFDTALQLQLPRAHSGTPTLDAAAATPMSSSQATTRVNVKQDEANGTAYAYANPGAPEPVSPGAAAATAGAAGVAAGTRRLSARPSSHTSPADHSKQSSFGGSAGRQPNTSGSPSPLRIAAIPASSTLTHALPQAVMSIGDDSDKLAEALLGANGNGRTITEPAAGLPAATLAQLPLNTGHVVTTNVAAGALAANGNMYNGLAASYVLPSAQPAATVGTHSAPEVSAPAVLAPPALPANGTAHAAATQAAEAAAELDTATKAALLQQVLQDGWPQEHVQHLLLQLPDGEVREMLGQALERHHAALQAAPQGTPMQPEPLLVALLAVQQQKAQVASQVVFMADMAQLMRHHRDERQQGQEHQEGQEQQQHQQQQLLLCGHDGAHMHQAPQHAQQNPQYHAQQLSQQPPATSAPPTINTVAAAAAAALFGDVAGSPKSPLNSLARWHVSDMHWGEGDGAPQQELSAQLMSLDSLVQQDVGPWDLLMDNLRQASGRSAGPRPLDSSSSFNTTDWIPDLLHRIESDDRLAMQPQLLQHAHGTKRERSSSHLAAAAAAAAARQQQLLASMLSGGGGEAPDWLGLRSASRAAFSIGDSFSRHFPTARVTSRDRNVMAGTQVTHAFSPTLRNSFQRRLDSIDEGARSLLPHGGDNTPHADDNALQPDATTGKEQQHTSPKGAGAVAGGAGAGSTAWHNGMASVRKAQRGRGSRDVFRDDGGDVHGSMPGVQSFASSSGDLSSGIERTGSGRLSWLSGLFGRRQSPP